MLNSGTHAMSAQAVTYPGAPKEPAPGHDLRGLGALYRIYDAADGYVFLAAPSQAEWTQLLGGLAPYADLGTDSRFGDAASRGSNATALIEALSAIFAGKGARDWEDELLAKGVACVAVHTDAIEVQMFDESFGRASGYVVDVVHPTFDEHPRVAPYMRFSRSRTQALPGVLAGQHTDEILTQLGKTPAEIADLRSRSIVA
jgi:crotonobetainyl-CoA:carnitine CoA-transferase CaiB-like acyl-CoA transferase